MVHDVGVAVLIDVLDVPHAMLLGRVTRPESNRTWVNRRGIEFFGGQDRYRDDPFGLQVDAVGKAARLDVDGHFKYLCTKFKSTHIHNATHNAWVAIFVCVWYGRGIVIAHINNWRTHLQVIVTVSRVNKEGIQIIQVARIDDKRHFNENRTLVEIVIEEVDCGRDKIIVRIVL